MLATFCERCGLGIEFQIWDPNEGRPVLGVGKGEPRAIFEFVDYLGADGTCPEALRRRAGGEEGFDVIDCPSADAAVKKALDQRVGR